MLYINPTKKGMGLSSGDFLMIWICYYDLIGKFWNDELT